MEFIAASTWKGDRMVTDAISPPIFVTQQSKVFLGFRLLKSELFILDTTKTYLYTDLPVYMIEVVVRPLPEV